MSRVAAVLAAFVAAVAAWFVTGLGLPENTQIALMGAISAAAAGLFPAWGAWFDEATAQLVSVLSVILSLGLDTAILKSGMSESQQQIALAVLAFLAALLAPAMTLQQATRFRPPSSMGDTRL